MGRASTVERGYGAEHQALRARWARVVEAGGVVCRCGRRIVPGSRWHLGHDHRNGGYVGPEHAGCNVAERNRRVRRKRRVKSREW